MNEKLIIKLKKENFIDKKIFSELTNNHNFGLYADNILEGLSFLNGFVLSADKILKFAYVMYEPVDQPTYIFKDSNNHHYSIKIFGAFYNWNLPAEVENLYKMMDIPDFAMFNLETKKTIFAGETTETASVGNSQWQREGRKISAASLGIPFIYQTFYSGKDESQDSVREPTSLQVLNHLMYSLKYKVPSFVIYLENNFTDGVNKTRETNAEELMISYFKTLIIQSSKKNLSEEKKDLERKILLHMLDYITEEKTIRKKLIKRVSSDFPILNKILLKILTDDKLNYVKGIVEYLNGSTYDQKSFNKLTDFDYSSMVNWTSYSDDATISKIRSIAINLNEKIISYQNRSKIGITKTKVIIDFLKSENLFSLDLLSLLNKDETVILPLRIHKKSNGKLTFSPDPESGEIVAFSELFKEKIDGTKVRNILGLCIVEPPRSFNLNDKVDTKMYKALARYTDLILIKSKLFYRLNKFVNTKSSNLNYVPTQKKLTEEAGVVSFFIPVGNSTNNYEISFIHTHHSSWQQFIIRNKLGISRTKINRISTKLDLVMQKNDTFILSEGKLEFDDFFISPTEILKIQTAFIETEKEINKIFNDKSEIYKSFICTIPNSKSLSLGEIKTKLEYIESKFKNNIFNKIVNDNYFLCVVYVLNGKTNYVLHFSKLFDSTMKKELERLLK
jgi:hypothetical protein